MALKDWTGILESQPLISEDEQLHCLFPEQLQTERLAGRHYLALLGVAKCLGRGRDVWYLRSNAYGTCDYDSVVGNQNHVQPSERILHQSAPA